MLGEQVPWETEEERLRYFLELMTEDRDNALKRLDKAEEDLQRLRKQLDERDRLIAELQKEIEWLQSWREAHDQVVGWMDHYREGLRRVIAAYRCGADADVMRDIAQEALDTVHREA
ncbi:MAG: hypothetical protein IRZ03_16385 [Acidobacterium ailaaui]|nr:hypothetical protein [Pseudacidobacterium ailaaui]